MTKKRFQKYYQGNTIVSIHDKENNNELVNILQCVDLLNELHEENKIFRTFIELNDFDVDEIIEQGKELK